MPDGFSMARAARAALLAYYSDFMDSWEPASESRFIPDVLGRFVLFEAYLRERIAEANPALNEIGGLGRLDTLLRRILPEFPAFLGIMDAYHTPGEDRRTNTPLHNTRPPKTPPPPDPPPDGGGGEPAGRVPPPGWNPRWGKNPGGGGGGFAKDRG